MNQAKKKTLKQQLHIFWILGKHETTEYTNPITPETISHTPKSIGSASQVSKPATPNPICKPLKSTVQISQTVPQQSTTPKGTFASSSLIVTK